MTHYIDITGRSVDDSLWKPVIYICLWCTFGIAILFGLAIQADRYSCHHSFSNVPTRYTAMTGCLVQTKQGWIPAKNYRTIDGVSKQ